MRALTKISIFLGIIIVDLVFFIFIRQFSPEGYEWIIATTSYYTQISLEVTRSLFVISGFAIVLICVPIILHFVHNLIKEHARSEY